ncbi:glycosyltransferase family 1 protein [Paucibacter sp. R3-3]|uniref:Glycosyltransferase family 1 protein n=1 Tax=Roseateles agri TaxID=3098619 RepID=A0ABU5DLT3_9BURK|nr:glycosyltransferase family 1 protein [Paucibacter sp. R3-3]MDY0747265.1 glycosyltransferase family 1 protein [Paucibacter sp. R3-3]
MKIGLVARCLNTAHVRGMGKYVLELLRQSGEDVAWHLFADDTRYPLLHPQGHRFTPDVFEFRGDRFRLWEQLGLPLRAGRLPLALLHCTEGALPLWQPLPTVVTLHDTLAFEERPDTAADRFYWDQVIPAALKRAAHVITISESSQRDILARWPELEPRLTVIHHGIETAYLEPPTAAVPDSLRQSLGDAAYVVYLGGPMKRKRFDWALKVLANQPDASLKLVACGFGADARNAARVALPHELQGRVLFAEFLSDAELQALYASAAAVLYPTLYEGFGFPAIEAQAAGVPVIFSPLGSLAELVGPLATLVPADDLAAWTAALDGAIKLSPEARAEKAAAAQTWAAGFRWQESYRKHLDVYRKVALK